MGDAEQFAFTFFDHHAAVALAGPRTRILKVERAKAMVKGKEKRPCSGSDTEVHSPLAEAPGRGSCLCRETREFGREEERRRD